MPRPSSRLGRQRFEVSGRSAGDHHANDEPRAGRVLRKATPGAPKLGASPRFSTACQARGGERTGRWKTYPTALAARRPKDRAAAPVAGSVVNPSRRTDSHCPN